MKEFLSVRGRKLLLQILICTIIIAASLAVNEKLYLLTGVFTGYLLAAICIWVMVYRTWKAAHLSVGKAKGQMWLSLIMRPINNFYSLAGCHNAFGRTVFLRRSAVFFLAMIVYMIHLAIFVYHKNME